MNKCASFFKKIKIEYLAVRFLMAWCFISIIKTIVIGLTNGYGIDDINFVGVTSFLFDIVINIMGGIICYIVFDHINKVQYEKKILFLLLCFYAVLSIVEVQNIYFAVGMVAILLISAVFCFKSSNNISTDKNVIINTKSETSKGLDSKNENNNKETDNKGRVSAIVIIVVAILAFTVFAGAMAALRYICYFAPNFDLGLFSQMFHYMKEDFVMNSTSERNRLLSHFCVHVSPVFYLILPVYMLFPSPLTLEIVQVVVVALGIIPFILICRHYKLDWRITALMGVCYAAYPALTGGCLFDIHENMFLPPFLLLLFLAIEKQSTWGIFLSAALVLGVKEDAAVYVAIIALFIMAEYKMYKKGAMLFVFAVIYFICTTAFLNANGVGVMSYRFGNMIYSQQEGLIGIIRTILANPIYVLTQIFNQEKTDFMMQMFLPVVFLPLMTLKWQRYILLVPLVLFNLMPNYMPEHNIFYQYVFGSAAILLYLTILNLKDFKGTTLKRIVRTVPVVSVMSYFIFIIYPKAGIFEQYNSVLVQKNMETFNETLKIIPKDASVAASTFFCAALSDRDELYDLSYPYDTSEYVALDLRYDVYNKSLNKYLNDEKYEMLVFKRGQIAIFRNTLW